MQRTTHTVIGTAAGYIIAGPVGAALGAMVASLPDDIEKPLGLEHRKASHSLWAVLLVGGIGWWLCKWIGVDVIYSHAVTASYAAHILADCLTISGVWWWWPVKQRWRLWLLPRPMRIRTGGPRDSLVGAGVGLWLGWNLIPEIYLLTGSLPPEIHSAIEPFLYGW